MSEKRLCIGITIFFLSGCVSLPPAAPENSMGSILAVSISIKQPIPVFESHIRSVYFVKIEQGGDIINQKNIIKSNYYNGDCIYLLNARPGRYAAVAAFEKDFPESGSQREAGGRASSYNSFYFSSEIIRLSEIEVMPGEISYMGSFTLRKPWSLSFTNADEAQLRFRRRLQPDFADSEKENSFLKLTFGTLCGSADYSVAVSSKELKKDLTSELDFLNKSLHHFKGGRLQRILYKKELAAGAGWQHIIKKRIEKINKIKNLDQDKNRWILIPE